MGNKDNILDYGRYFDIEGYRSSMQSTRMDDEAKLLRKLETGNYNDEEACKLFGGIELKELIKKLIIYHGSHHHDIESWEEEFGEKFYKNEKEKHEWDDLYDL